jgi:Na+-driven multidrug efflux pump
MRLFTNNEVLIEIAARYSRIMAFSMFLNSFTIVYIGARRSCGAPKFGTVVVSISAVVNVLLNYMLIFGNFGAPALGVEGAAIGTMITRGLEVCITIGFIIFADRKVKIMPLFMKHLLNPGKIILIDFFKYSAPVIFNETLWSVGVSIYIVIYGHMAASADIIAANSLAGNVERLILLAVFSIGNAAAVFIGKSIGSGKNNQQVYALGKTFLMITLILGIGSGLALLALTFGIIQPFVFPLLDLSDAAKSICIFMLIIRSIFTPIRALNGVCMVGVLRGGGDVKFILVADVIGIYFWAIPLALLGAFVFNLNIYTIYLIIMSEDIIKVLLGLWRFRTRYWIRNLTRDIT